MFNINRKRKKKEKEWTRLHCPKCNALLFEIDANSYTKESVRVKCRLCKKIDVH